MGANPEAGRPHLEARRPLALHRARSKALDQGLQGEDIDTSKLFHAKFFPLGKTNALRGKISSFHQTGLKSIPEAWERLQEYILACPHHGMDEWLVLQSFYNRLMTTSKANIDAAAGGAFLDLTIASSKALVKKIVSNQGWSDE